ncbi:hypothetical protein FHW69_002904 [Luteibacter sp. Sphag1AF]|uniref:hypothetical protein n=1 Tax=Luteibacter sp. Sphag1AF TaxID=2587031 RepID=UPI001617E519|nr:hypothetical protein [Luteibacter sp. Sphag1AF]MBB3228269.1 hypothetical protein [Luteibacter sp. Sphag1AF]
MSEPALEDFEKGIDDATIINVEKPLETPLLTVSVLTPANGAVAIFKVPGMNEEFVQNFCLSTGAFSFPRATRLRFAFKSTCSQVEFGLFHLPPTPTPDPAMAAAFDSDGKQLAAVLIEGDFESGKITLTAPEGKRIAYLELVRPFGFLDNFLLFP